MESVVSRGVIISFVVASVIAAIVSSAGFVAGDVT